MLRMGEVPSWMLYKLSHLFLLRNTQGLQQLSLKHRMTDFLPYIWIGDALIAVLVTMISSNLEAPNCWTLPKGWCICFFTCNYELKVCTCHCCTNSPYIGILNIRYQFNVSYTLFLYLDMHHGFHLVIQSSLIHRRETSSISLILQLNLIFEWQIDHSWWL